MSEVEQRRIAARPVCSPGMEQLRQPGVENHEGQPTLTAVAGAAAAGTRAVANESDLTADEKASASAPAAVPYEAYKLGRRIARGRTSLQASYAWWRATMSAMHSVQQRQDLLTGALDQLDKEMGPELVQVSGKGRGRSRGG